MTYEDEQDAHLRRMRNPAEVLRTIAQQIADKHDLGVDHGSFDALAAKCDEPVHARPEEPQADAHVWYRGWEVGFSFESEYWCGEGWIAYKGGCDLDAREVRSGQYATCLDAIDDEEDE